MNLAETQNDVRSFMIFPHMTGPSACQHYWSNMVEHSKEIRWIYSPRQLGGLTIFIILMDSYGVTECSLTSLYINHQHKRLKVPGSKVWS